MTKVIDYTKALVEIPSVSGNEQKCLDFMASWMSNKGLNDIVITTDYVAGYKKGSNPHSALILTGHIDTVSEGNLDAWQSNPWRPIIDDDKLRGLGTSDMKGGVAATMAAIESVDNPAVDTWLVIVSNEEVDGRGTAEFSKYFAKNYSYDQASAIILEPTDLERIEIGHRGNAFIELSFQGQAGHGSQQDSFDASALGKATYFLADIAKIANNLVTRFTDPILGTPSIVPTGINAGNSKSPNKTPDSADLTVDIRTTPALDETLDTELDQLGKKYSFTWREIANRVGSSLCSPDAPIVGSLLKEAGELPTAISHGATDQGFLQQIGVDTVVFGPGEFSQAHAQNEWISCNKLEKATSIVARLVKG